ncbi:MAG: neutral zinc metallopeptidase [Labilithrix sp.]|nr:neutral zinc metallopeptidase [Labilithrix sp.]MCW5817823.1 neutral zinc metallopeptidase [Labilithrix sp.]
MRFLVPVGIVIALLVVGVGFIVGGAEDEPVGVTATTGASVEVEDERQERFAAFVLDDAQATWRMLFARAGKRYEDAKLVLYRDETEAACGFGKVATGPFYCPTDDRVSVDLSFHEELARPAQAYVLAHEIGHHVQDLLGATATVKIFRRSQREGEPGANVRLELQADCYAGVWAHTTQKRGLLEEGDVDEALRAAAALGADRRTGGRVSPETFTHGTSDQRRRWFKAGFEHGAVDSCDTFSASGL